MSFSATLQPAELHPLDRFSFDTWRLSANDATLSPSLSWNLFNSFKDSLSVRSRRLDRDSAERDLEIELQSQTLKALRAYYGLVLREKLLEVSKENLKARHEQYLLTKSHYDNGMKSLSDLLKTETDWRSSELNVATAEAEMRLAVFRFNVLISREEGLTAELETDLTLGTTEAPVLEEGLRSALMKRPEMIKNGISLKKADTTYRQALLGALPSLSLDFDMSHSHSMDYGQPTSAWGLGTATYNFTLKLALPASFNFFSQVRDVQTARASWKRTYLSKVQINRSIREEVYQAHIGLLRALRSYEISVRKEEISRQNLDLVKEQYDQGSADVIRLSQALIDYVNAQVERVRAFHDASINRAQYRRAIGERIWD